MCALVNLLHSNIDTVVYAWNMILVLADRWRPMIYELGQPRCGFRVNWRCFYFILNVEMCFFDTVLIMPQATNVRLFWFLFFFVRDMIDTTTRTNTMSIDLKIVQLTADVLENKL